MLESGSIGYSRLNSIPITFEEAPNLSNWLFLSSFLFKNFFSAAFRQGCPGKKQDYNNQSDMYGACEGRKKYGGDEEDGQKRKKTSKDNKALFSEKGSTVDDAFKRKELKEILTFLGIGCVQLPFSPMLVLLFISSLCRLFFIVFILLRLTEAEMAQR